MMNQNARRVIRVTPTITGVTYANNDILFDTTEIPLAVGKPGECSKLVSAMIISKSNSVFDAEIFFCQVNQSVGTVNAARNVSDADFATAKVMGTLTLDGSADDYNYGGGRIFRFDRNQEGFAETAGDDVFLIKNAPVPAGSSLEIIAGSKIIMQANDILRIRAGVASKIDATVSYLDQT